LKEAGGVGKTMLMGIIIEGRMVSKVGEGIVRGVVGRKAN